MYLLLNSVYSYGANVDELAGKVEVGLIAGPRVYYALCMDVDTFRGLTRTNKDGAPVNALLLQGTVASLISISGSVDQILSYAGFTLALMLALAVFCVIILRVRRPEMQRPFRVWAYPLPPLFFVVVNIWTMYWAFLGRPVESTLALFTLAAGAGIFLAASAIRR